MYVSLFIIIKKTARFETLEINPNLTNTIQTKIMLSSKHLDGF